MYYLGGSEDGNKYPGKTKLRAYAIWEGIIQRCCNPKCKDYYKYGAIGRGVCDEWRDSDAFLDWAFSNGYADDLSLDRIDNTKGYYPDNCRFATRFEQNTNKLNNRLITFRGKTLTVTEMAQELGMPPKRLQTRLEHNWSVEDACTLPRCARPKERNTPFQDHRKAFNKDTKEVIKYDY